MFLSARAAQLALALALALVGEGGAEKQAEPEALSGGCEPSVRWCQHRADPALTPAELPLTAAVSLAEKLRNSAHRADWGSLSNWAAAIFAPSALSLLQQEPGTGNHQQLGGAATCRPV